MYNIDFTPEAAKHITAMLEHEHGIGIRFSVKKTGCAGLSYVPSIVSHDNPEDISFIWDKQFKVYLDAATAQYFHNVLIDYGSTEKNTNLNLAPKRLIFLNPNEKSRCGCGESFHV